MKKSHKCLLVFIVCFFPLWLSAASTSHYRFRNFSPKGGFCYQGINAITQDKDGFIWFSGTDNLFMFDGYQTINFSNVFYELKESEFYSFTTLFTDLKGRTFVGTNHGMFLLDNRTRRFRYLCKGSYQDINGTENSIIWLICNNNLFKYQFEDNQLISLQNTEIASLNKSEINDFYNLACYRNEAWIVTKQGDVMRNNSENEIDILGSYHPSSTVVKIAVDKSYLYFLEQKGIVTVVNKNNLSQKVRRFNIINPDEEKNIFRELFVDGENIWVGSRKGLFLMSLKTNNITKFMPDVNDSYSLVNKSVWTIFKDMNAGLWFGTYLGGLCYHNQYDHSFKHYKQNDNNSLNSNIISGFAEDRNGNLWVATDGAGVYFFNSKQNTFRSYKVYEPEYRVNSRNSIKKMVMNDDKSRLYLMGLFDGGVDVLNLTTGKIIPAPQALSINENDEKKTLLQQYGKSGIWTGSNTSGLTFYDFNSDLALNFTTLNKLLESDLNQLNLMSTYRDLSGNIWIATRKGLLYLDLKTGKHKVYTKANKTIIWNDLTCVYEDSEQNVWVGTNGMGLLLLEADTRKLSAFNDNDGFTASSVYGILEDDSHCLWLSTNNGLFRFDKKEKIFHRFDLNDGIQGNMFYPNAYFKCSSGEMLFGGTNGFNMFHPKDIILNKEPFHIYASDIYVSGISIFQHPDSSILNNYLSDSIIQLKYNQKSISILFTTDNYLIPEKTVYAYKLTGIDSNWKYLPDGKRLVDLYDLAEGECQMEVKASNNDGIESASKFLLKIVVLPPPWRSIYAKIAYLFIFLVIVLLIIRVAINRQKDKNLLLREKSEKEKIEEISRIKINFFTKISHELRTPLTLISVNLRSLQKQISTDDSRYQLIDMAYRNVYRVMNLINQLLDIRAIEEKKLIVKNNKIDVVAFMNNLIALFVPKANEQDLSLEFYTNLSSLIIYIDVDKTEKIMFNLLSNALKYTEEKGYIDVSLAFRKPDEIQLKVVSQSVIPTENLQHIFNLFYQSGNTDATSSGIGLAYTKELVEILNGNISAQSEPGMTTFTVTLPVSSGNTSEEPVCEPKLYYSKKYKENIKLPQEISPENLVPEKLPSILIADDDTDLRSFLYRELSNDFNISLAPDGQEVMTMIKKHNFRVIVSDISMPKMDGYELCRALKSDEETDHIPIILLTAMTNDINRIKGMELGAEVYISKPFDIDFLRLQIKNLISLQDALRKTFSHSITDISLPDSKNLLNTRLLEKAIEIVEKHLDDTTFDVDTLVVEIGVGRTVFFKKIKALTNLTPNEFIMNVRMKKAAQLLLNSQHLISEVAYMVGFNDQSYFSTCFKRFFGQSPKTFAATRGQD